MKGKAAAIPPHRNFAGFHNSPVMISQYRDEHPIFELCLRWPPVDVKIMGKPARLSVFQDVPPPGVSAAGNAHVVWHNVQKQLKAVLTGGLAKPQEGRLASQLGVHAPVI